MTFLNTQISVTCYIAEHTNRVRDTVETPQCNILVVLSLLLTWQQPGCPPLCSCWPCQPQRPSLPWRPACWRGSQSLRLSHQRPARGPIKQSSKKVRLKKYVTSRKRPCRCSDIIEEKMTLPLTSSLLGVFRGAVAATASNLMGVVVSLKMSDTSWVMASCIFPFRSWKDEKRLLELVSTFVWTEMSHCSLMPIKSNYPNVSFMWLLYSAKTMKLLSKVWMKNSWSQK